MTITEKEISEDFMRFLRHEAMRANCTQDEIAAICSPVLSQYDGHNKD